MATRVEAFISRRWSVPQGRFRVRTEPLRGGLESQVVLARIHQRESPRPIPARLVIKQLRPGFEREADVYQLLWDHLDRPPAVRVLGRDICGEATYLYLEDARPVCSWPWTETATSGAVCRVLARLHDAAYLPREPLSWDYESELAASAAATFATAKNARDEYGTRYWRRLGDLSRVVEALPLIRNRLLSCPTTVIHGDVHPGNVILRSGNPEPDVVLIDWARARVGSPFEDVASWLHSLGCWEPQARRRHDTLMRAYLDARAVSRAFDAGLRVEYWFASVSNGLSGAIRYHLAVLSDPVATAMARYDSGRALAAWERVVRAAAALVKTSVAR